MFQLLASRIQKEKRLIDSIRYNISIVPYECKQGKYPELGSWVHVRPVNGGHFMLFIKELTIISRTTCLSVQRLN